MLFALRPLRRQPGFLAIAVCRLTLGITSTIAVFSLFYQILLRTLPVPSPRELVVALAAGSLPSMQTASVRPLGGAAA